MYSEAAPRIQRNNCDWGQNSGGLVPSCSGDVAIATIAGYLESLCFILQVRTRKVFMAEY